MSGGGTEEKKQDLEEGGGSVVEDDNNDNGNKNGKAVAFAARSTVVEAAETNDNEIEIYRSSSTADEVGGGRDAVVDVEEEEEDKEDEDDDDEAEVAFSSGRSAAAAAAAIDDSPIVSKFKDHFTLALPTSTVRYRSGGGAAANRGAARVIQESAAQYILEETVVEKKNDRDDDGDDRVVTIRRIHDTSEGLRFLRASYATVTAFWTGFLFIFCLQVLLFLMLNLALEAGVTSKQGLNVANAAGVLLSFPAFVYGLASSMVIAGAFIMDTWRGHFLIRNFTFRTMKHATTEWIFFLFFLGFPVVVLCGTLLAGRDDFWPITALVWIFSVAAFYLLFAINVIFYEMRACWEVVRTRYKNEFDSSDHGDAMSLIRRSILLRQVSRYSGHKRVHFLSIGSVKNAEETDKDQERSNMVRETYTEHLGIIGRMTTGKSNLWRLCCCCCNFLGLYEDISDSPERVYTVEDARDVRPFVTSYTWTLEKMFCRPRNSRYVAIVKGQGAVTRNQMRSSFACSVLGNALIVLLVVSFLVYLESSTVVIVMAVLIAAIVAVPPILSSIRLFGLADKIKKAQQGTDDSGALREGSQQQQKQWTKPPASHMTFYEQPAAVVLNKFESEGMYVVSEQYRVSRATPRLCWIMFTLEVTFLYLWPLVSLFMVGNYPLGLLFVVVAGISFMRYYMNAAVVLEETGHMNLVDEGRDEREKWRNQSRLSEIVGNITRGRSLGAWTAVLGILGFTMIALAAGTVGFELSAQTTHDEPFTYLPDFAYVQKNNSLRYPTCTFTNDLGTSPLNSMADYAYMAGLAYRGINVTQRELDGWFQNGPNVTDNADLVRSYRQNQNVQSAVSFKLFTVPIDDNNEEEDADAVTTTSGTSTYAYVSIRGTTNPWDALTDMQLWMPAFLMQILRLCLPVGGMWTPVIPYLINAITVIESKSVESVSFYKDTSKFVRFLQQQGQGGGGEGGEAYAGVSTTGHSLGGGLSIITGASTGVPAVALSGPNAVLSRMSFDPKVRLEELDGKTFNIMPARDIVAMIDDPAQNVQRIRCLAGRADPIGCHDSTRSLCEILYQCGTDDRPALCECVRQYDYPEPVPLGERTFDEACPIVVN